VLVVRAGHVRSRFPWCESWPTKVEID